jgi:hypothetical protein
MYFNANQADVWTRVLEYLAEPTNVPLQEQGVRDFFPWRVGLCVYACT